MILRLVSALSISTLLFGCGTLMPADNYAEHKDVHNLTPELEGLGKTAINNDVILGKTNQQNNRMLYDDLMRAFHVDQPTALSPYPVVKTSGTPR